MSRPSRKWRRRQRRELAVEALREAWGYCVVSGLAFMAWLIYASWRTGRPWGVLVGMMLFAYLFYWLSGWWQTRDRRVWEQPYRIIGRPEVRGVVK